MRRAFLTGLQKANAGGAEGAEYLMGVGLLVLSLACDGFTGPMQEKVFSSNQRPPPLAMMFYSNVFASVYSFVGVPPSLTAFPHSPTQIPLAALALSPAMSLLLRCC